MAYEFFLSYTRSNYDRFMQEFFEDLSTEVGVRRKTRSNDPIGFFDEKRLERGDDWEARIVQALQHSKVLVCLYSDAYFESVYCGKEWHVFHKRRDLHVRRLQAIGQQSIDMPPIIKPIRWLPFTRNLADPVGKVHYDYGEHNGVYNTQGLRSIIKLKDSQHKDFYVKFIEDLANEI